MSDELNSGEEIGPIKRHRDDPGNPPSAKVRKIFDGDKFFIVDSDGAKYDVTQWMDLGDDRKDFEGWKP